MEGYAEAGPHTMSRGRWGGWGGVWLLLLLRWLCMVNLMVNGVVSGWCIPFGRWCSFIMFTLAIMLTIMLTNMYVLHDLILVIGFQPVSVHTTQ